ncbi:MAG: phenylalanine--tRNA ligase subunit beta [Acidobacteria bacterium]|nr:phenylalanine--tRNA ligase subunit beta [Acidobacteriota bacterium]
MKISPQWLREFVPLAVDDRRLGADLSALGLAVEGVLGEREDTVFEMEIGTNRPDAMNHYGIAREAAALYRAALKPLGRQARPTVQDSVVGQFEIDIQHKEGCARYTAAVIRGVAIARAPESITRRLALVDQRPINNAADASNYTLWEMGHPTHAVDLDLLEGGKIIVRRAQEGEMLKTLDGVDRKLSAEDLIIADENKPVALAGIMGGFDTMISQQTRNILVESAWFDPITVRKAAKRHGLHTDASHRFERGADYQAGPVACGLVAERIIESGGGELVLTVDKIGRELDLAPVVLRMSEIHRILGSRLAADEVAALLARLGFELVPETAEPAEFSVRIPSWRLDVEREIDLIEEVARLHGYNNFPSTLPPFAGAVVRPPLAAQKEKLRSLLLAMGYNEGLSLTFISHADAETFSSSPVVELANPLSEEASLMRSSLVPGMLHMLAHNLNRGRDDVRLFEIGDVYQSIDRGTAEHSRICLGATFSALLSGLTKGAVLEKSSPGSEVDVFRSLKGDIETLLCAFEHTSLSFDCQTPEYYHPGRSARALMDGEPVAQFGQLHPQAAAERKLRQAVFIAELESERLYLHSLREIHYQPLLRFPAVERDFSFLFPDHLTFEKIRAAVEGMGVSQLRSFRPVEIFRGNTVPAGEYSILLRARFQAAERTLREEEVAEWSSKIVSGLERLGGEQRS